MKLIALSMVLSLNISAFCQDSLPRLTPQHVGMEKIVFLDSSLSASKIYDRALQWFVTTFNSVKSVVELQDREAGSIVGHPAFRCELQEGLGKDGFVTYNISIWCKNGKYKYQIDNLEWKSLVDDWKYPIDEFISDQYLIKKRKKMISKTTTLIVKNLLVITTDLEKFMGKSNDW